jgi:hypothetical protein
MQDSQLQCSCCRREVHIEPKELRTLLEHSNDSYSIGGGDHGAEECSIIPLPTLHVQHYRRNFTQKAFATGVGGLLISRQNLKARRKSR